MNKYIVMYILHFETSDTAFQNIPQYRCDPIEAVSFSDAESKAFQKFSIINIKMEIIQITIGA